MNFNLPQRTFTMTPKTLCHAAAETAHHSGAAAARQFIADTLKTVEEAHGKDAAMKLNMGALGETILTFRKGAAALDSQTLTDCKRITGAASKAAADNHSQHWRGENMLRAYRDACRDILALEAATRTRGCAPWQWETISVQALPERLLLATCTFMAEACPAIVNAASDQAQAAADMRDGNVLFNGTVVTTLCVAHERLQGHSDMIKESGWWHASCGWLPGVLKNILAVIKHIEFMGRHHAPKANPFSGLFVMKLEAELATLEKTLTA